MGASESAERPPDDRRAWLSLWSWFWGAVHGFRCRCGGGRRRAQWLLLQRRGPRQRNKFQNKNSTCKDVSVYQDAGSFPSNGYDPSSKLSGEISGGKGRWTATTLNILRQLASGNPHVERKSRISSTSCIRTCSTSTRTSSCAILRSRIGPPQMCSGLRSTAHARGW